MKLKSIELQGFKSFVDRTALTYDAGITAILGPNGCGKSNIVDAVRWVLGEQSAKTLRGDRMEDIIFKGTTRRKPVGLAEVSLTFDNSSRRLPIEFDEVGIRRRVTRDGISEYYLNGSPCRLKDIRDLLYDSGAGNTAYSIIEHAMINQVLNEHNQELRRLIEEASGITKYKVRRRETQRKLDRTEQDIVRLNDIIEEIGREVRSLKYQVGKARRHQRLFQHIHALDLALAERTLRKMDSESKGDRDRLSELRTQAEADSGELGGLRARIEEARPAVDEREAERRRLEDSLRAYEEELQEVERKALLLEHRIGESENRSRENQDAIGEAEQREQQIRTQIGQLTENLDHLETDLAETKKSIGARREDVSLLEQRLTGDRKALETATQLSLEFIETNAERQSNMRELEVRQENRRDRLTALAAENEQIERLTTEAAVAIQEQEQARDRQADRRRALLGELAATERRQSDLQADAAEIQQELSDCNAQCEAAKSKQELLARIMEEYEGYGQGARRVLQTHAQDERVFGSMADRLQVADDFLPAFETLLAELLDAVVVDEPATAVGLASELRQQKAGRATFVSRRAGGEIDSGFEPPASGRPAGELISGSSSSLPYLKRLLAGTFVFENDGEALAAAENHTGSNAIVCLSRSGLLVTSDGVLRGGRSEGEEIGLLGRREKLEELADRIKQLGNEIELRQQRLQRNQAEQDQVREAIVRGRGELEIVDDDVRKLHVAVAEWQSRLQSGRKRSGEIASERESLGGELQSLVEQESQLRTELAESGRKRDDSSVRCDELRLAVVAAEQERDVSREELENLRLNQERLEGDCRKTETAQSHLRESLAELAAQRDRLHQENDLGKQERLTLSTELSEHKQRIQAGMAERQRRRQIVNAAAEAIQALHEETASWHDRIKQIEDARAACREQMHEIETGLATRDVRRRNLIERIEEQYSGSFEDLVGAVEPEHFPKELQRDGDVFQYDQAKELLATLRDKLASLGPINQLALEEYDAKSERLTFLENQKTDVQKAKEDLITAINRINRTARKLFSETFEEVRRNFIAVFQVLFEGGRAELNLTRTDDPLESNIHIVAQPRGKVVNHVGLLSGGERCLTALSLLFGVYLVKPSPFCMLDEIDAPLDDANIQRFVKMLREFSHNTQFLVVTHNKLTMETANHLYGVTMMEEGVSSIVSVNFKDVADTQSDVELGQAIARRRRALDRRESLREILSESEAEEPGVRFTLEDPGAAAAADAADTEVPVPEEAISLTIAAEDDETPAGDEADSPAAGDADGAAEAMPQEPDVDQAESGSDDDGAEGKPLKEMEAEA